MGLRTYYSAYVAPTIRVQVMCARIYGFFLPTMQCNSVDLAFYQDFVFNFYFNVDYSDAPPRLLSFQLISRARVLPTPIYGVHMSPPLSMYWHPI